MSIRGAKAHQLEFEMLRERDSTIAFDLHDGVKEVHFNLQCNHVGSFVQASRETSGVQVSDIHRCQYRQDFDQQGAQSPRGIHRHQKEPRRLHSVQSASLQPTHRMEVQGFSCPRIPCQPHEDRLRRPWTVHQARFEICVDEMALAQAKLPTTAIARALAQLNYLTKVIPCGLKCLLAIIESASQHKDGWYQLVQVDLEWLAG